MELLQIITFSIKLFALVTAIIVLSSYLIYKIKDRKRNKPYSKITVARPEKENAVPALQYAAEPYENSALVIAPVENVQYNNIAYETPYFENNQYQMQPAAAAFANSQPRQSRQRFKIINEENGSMLHKGHFMEKLQPVTVEPQRFSSRNQAQAFNIYDYYSSNNYEPMHKIGL